MLKIGLFGAGHLGKIHLKCIKNIPDYELIGFYDPNPEQSAAVESELGVKSFSNPDDLIDAVDVIDIVTPTPYHYETAIKVLNKGKHCFIEKPVASTVEESREIARLSKEKGLKVQIGHVERFNPAFKASEKYLTAPKFIETHRLAKFNPRGNDVPVILDLMIHDLDVVLHSVKSEVEAIHASGVCVVSDTPDIANARIEFENGCVANITASRLSIKNMRKSRFFQEDAYISVDFLEKEAEIVRLKEVDGPILNPFSMVLDLGEDKGKKEILFNKPKIEEGNAIQEELATFYEAIVEDKEPIVPIEAGHRALEVAMQIVEKVDKFIKKSK